MHTHTLPFAKKLILSCAFTWLAALTACKDNTPPAPASGPSIAATAASPVAPQAASSPATVPTAPVGPVGQTTPSGQPTQSPVAPAAERKDDKTNLLNSTAVTRSPSQPVTSAPDPFPPRPTPTILMQDGKIKQQWQAPAEAADLISTVKDQPNAAQIGREFYMQKCVDCHGKEGQGNGWMAKMVAKPPTNLASQMVQANSDGELFWKITNGRSPMPAHRVRFTDEQRWYIVAFLRTLTP